MDEDTRYTLSEIVSFLGMSMRKTHETLTKCLGLRKVCALSMTMLLDIIKKNLRNEKIEISHRPFHKVKVLLTFSFCIFNAEKDVDWAQIFY